MTDVAFLPIGPNDLGFPATWPTGSFRVGPGQPAPDGWAVLDEATYDELLRSLDPQVAQAAESRAAIAAAELTLAETKQNRCAALSIEVRDFIYVHYRPDQQAALTALMVEAGFTGKTQVLSYIRQALGWVNLAIGLYYPARAAVIAASDITAADAVRIDYDALPADPRVDVEVVRSMLRA
jgi:hypothetical protein